MIWETNKLLKLIDKKKWNNMDDKQKKYILFQIQIMVAINYLVHLHLSKLSIKRQLKLLLKYHKEEPKVFYPLTEKDLIELFFKLQPLIPIILYYNYEYFNKEKRTTQKKSKITEKQSKNKNMKGGYLFMLTSRGEKPIRGVDMEKFLEKMDETVQDISYLPSAGPSNPGEPSNPFNGFALLYFLSRNKLDNAGFYASPYIWEYLNIFDKTQGIRGNSYKYSTLLRLWNKYQEEIKRSERDQTMNQEFMENYESFIKKYMGRKELREKREEYKKYLNNLEKYKQRNEIEQKLMEAYDKSKPIPPSNLKKLEGPMSYLDMITQVTSLIG
jgi:hypothetical protein